MYGCISVYHNDTRVTFTGYTYVMSEYQLKKRIAILFTVAISSFITWLLPYFSIPQTSENLTVTFLDIGQGDSILVETPDGVQLLIDGGPDGTVLRRLTEELPWFDRTLDIIVGTHPDKDHIGGLVDVLARFKVNQIITTENTGDTMVAATFQNALVSERVPVVMVRAGQVYQIGASTTLTIFSPANNPVMLESNTASIVAKLSYGEIDFMLTGDAPSSIEEYLVKTYGKQLESEVLKLGHHGSKTSSSGIFLDTVQPIHAVVSTAKDNTYGHPFPAVVEAVESRGITLINTASVGSVTFETNGIDLWQK